MKRIHLLALVPCVLSSGCFVARQQRPDFWFGVDAATKYVHRGMVQNDRGVLQGEMNVTLPTVDGGQIDVNLWTNMDLRDETGDAWFPDGHAYQFSELDVTGAWSRSFEEGDLTLGLRTYNLPNGAEFPFGARGGTAEVFATLGREWRAYYPSFSVYYDYDEVQDVYLNGRVQRWFQFDDPRLSGEASVSLGVSGSKHSAWAYGTATGGLADLQAAFDLFYRYDEITTYRFFVAGSTIVDGDIQDGFDSLGIDSDNLWAGVGVSWSL